MQKVSRRNLGFSFVFIHIETICTKYQKKQEKNLCGHRGKADDFFIILYENNTTIIDTRQLIPSEKMNSEKLGFQPKKNISLYFAKLFRQAGLEKQSANVFYCSRDISTDENFRVKTISSCRTRLCPVCSWRLSLKTYKVLNLVTTNVAKKGSDFVFITLTVQNCAPNELKNTIDKIVNAFGKFYRRKEMKKAFDGIVRSLEVTYNAVNNTYHPHFHVLAHCRGNYFSKDDNIYLSHEKLKLLWKDCLGTDYEPYVDIRAFKNSTDEELKKSIAEVSKYCVKGSDITDSKLSFEQQAETLGTLFCALDGRRLLSYQGIFKEVKKELELDENNFTDLDENDISEAERIFTYIYSEKEYFEIVDEDYLP